MWSFFCINDHQLELLFITTLLPHFPASFPPTMTGIQPLDGGTFQPKSLPKAQRAYVHGSLFGKLVRSELKTEKVKKVPHVYRTILPILPRSHISKLNGTYMS